MGAREGVVGLGATGAAGGGGAAKTGATAAGITTGGGGINVLCRGQNGIVASGSLSAFRVSGETVGAAGARSALGLSRNFMPSLADGAAPVGAGAAGASVGASLAGGDNRGFRRNEVVGVLDSSDIRI